jgi:hypothetical protein
MPFCPKCRDEFQGWVRICPDCNLPLAEKLAEDKLPPEYKFIKVYTTAKQGEIALIKSILDGNNIPYYIKGENFSTLYGPADGLSLMDIMIRQDHLEDAKELLKEFIRPKE